MSEPPVAQSNTFYRIVATALFGTVVGVVGALAALLLFALIDLANDLLLISPRSRMMQDNSLLLGAMTVAVPAIGGLVTGLLLNFGTGNRRADSLPELIEAVQARRRSVPIRDGLTSALAALVSLGSGASAGHYGPVSHLGGLAGASIARVSRTPGLATIGVGCGVAAAISAVFNAPIAGLVFAHEVVLRHYSLRAFAPITVASTMGFILANMVFEFPPLFRIHEISVSDPVEYLAFIATGLAGAFIAVLFMQSIRGARHISRGIGVPPWCRPMLAGIALGCVALAVPDVLGIGRELLRFATIDGAFATGELVSVLILKILVTAMCLGFGFAGGVFSPALVIGALFGALTGSAAETLFGAAHSEIAVYAICGMVAVTSPVIGAPLTTILIVFELTRNYELTTAVMVSVVFSNLVSYRVFGRSWFDRQLQDRGFDLSLGRDRVILEDVHVRDILERDFRRYDSFEPLDQVRDSLLESDDTEAQVVDESGQYIGTLSVNQILIEERDADGHPPLAGECARPAQLLLTGEDSIWEAMERIGHFVGEHIPVIRSADDDTLIGVVSEADIVRCYLDTVYEIRREENAVS